jgi:hypothetical protein
MGRTWHLTILGGCRSVVEPVLSTPLYNSIVLRFRRILERHSKDKILFRKFPNKISL